MSKFSEYNLMRLSGADDEDAYDLFDYESDEIEEELLKDSESFIELYKAFYDDVKTSKNVYKEDW